MKDKIYPLLLALIFIIHNGEEYFSFDQMPKLFKKFMNRQSFLFSISILSILVLVVCLLNYCLENKILKQLQLLILFSLGLNSIQHIVFSLWSRKIIPGTISATVLMFPFALFYYSTLTLDSPTLIRTLILTPLFMGLAILGSLWFGNLLIKKGE